MTENIRYCLKKNGLQKACIVAGLFGTITYIAVLSWHMYFYQGILKGMNFSSTKEMMKIFESESNEGTVLYVAGADSLMILLYCLLFFGAVKKVACLLCSFVTLGIFRTIVGVLFIYPLIKSGSSAAALMESLDVAILICLLSLAYSLNQQMVIESAQAYVLTTLKTMSVESPGATGPPLYVTPSSRYFTYGSPYATPGAPPQGRSAPAYNPNEGIYAIPKMFD